MCLVIEDHLVVDDVGEPTLEGAHGFHGCLPGGNLAVVVGAAFAVAVAQLHDGHDVQDPVDLPVARAREPVTDLVAGGGGRSGRCCSRRRSALCWGTG